MSSETFFLESPSLFFTFFQIYNMNRRDRKVNRNRTAKLENRFNSLIRKNVCWNCFQVGHKRFQCPHPKQSSCSFCRRPSVLSVECGCELSRQKLAVRSREIVDETPNYNENVIVPVNQPNGVIEYQQDDNLMIVIESEAVIEEKSENDEDYVLEIYADTDSLSDL